MILGGNPPFPRVLYETLNCVSELSNSKYIISQKVGGPGNKTWSTFELQRSINILIISHDISILV